MIFNEEGTLYDVLGVSVAASTQEIREAYLKNKITYQRDSIALYTLVLPEEREVLIRKIEEAYIILSDSEKRREYDQNHELFTSSHPSNSTHHPHHERFSPPLEATTTEDDFMGSTQSFFENAISTPAASSCNVSLSDPLATPIQDPFPEKSPFSPFKPSSTPHPENNLNKKIAKAYEKIDIQAPTDPIGLSLLEEIRSQTEWSGSFLKKVRSSQQVSLEEMAGITKVTKNYLSAIEEENFSKLPAAVYVRGFVNQIAKILKLPHESVTVAYMKRYKAAKKD